MAQLTNPDTDNWLCPNCGTDFRFDMHAQTDYTYHCDICSSEKNWDTDIHWLTSSYGICDECYQSLSEEERDKLAKKYE